MTAESGGFVRGIKNVQAVLWVAAFIVGGISSGIYAYMDLVARSDRTQHQIARIVEIQMYQLRNDAWQTQALEHLAQKNPGQPPRRPDALRGQLVELLSR